MHPCRNLQGIRCHSYRSSTQVWIPKRASAVDKAIQEAEIINKAIHDLAKVQDKAVLAAFGIEPTKETDSSESEGEEDPPECVGMPVEDSADVLGGEKEDPVNLDRLVPLMQQSDFNWFEFCDKVEALMESEKEVSDITESFSSNLALGAAYQSDTSGILCSPE